jgi:hypothetical protein
MALGITTSVKTYALLDAIETSLSGRIVGLPRPPPFSFAGPQRCRRTGSKEFGYGTLYSGARFSTRIFAMALPRPLRWRVCECIAVPRAEPRLPRVLRTLRNPEAPGRAVLLKPKETMRRASAVFAMAAFDRHLA